MSIGAVSSATTYTPKAATITAITQAKIDPTSTGGSQAALAQAKLKGFQAAHPATTTAATTGTTTAATSATTTAGAPTTLAATPATAATAPAKIDTTTAGGAEAAVAQARLKGFQDAHPGTAAAATATGSTADAANPFARSSAALASYGGGTTTSTTPSADDVKNAIASAQQTLASSVNVLA